MELNVKQLSLENFNVKGFRKFGQHHFHQSSNPAKLYYQHIRDMGSFSKMSPLTKEQQEKEEKPLKKQQEKQEKELDAGTKAEAEAETTCTAGGATDQNIEEETSADDKVPGKLLGKRAGKPTPTDMEHDLKKKKKLESKIQDQDKAGPSKGEGKASKKEEQKQELFNVPHTPPRANDGPAPTTPEGRQQPPPINPIYTPARPKSKSRLIKDEPLLEDSTKLD